jgi:hypothetical protein
MTKLLLAATFMNATGCSLRICFSRMNWMALVFGKQLAYLEQQNRYHQ